MHCEHCMQVSWMGHRSYAMGWTVSLTLKGSTTEYQPPPDNTGSVCHLTKQETDISTTTTASSPTLPCTAAWWMHWRVLDSIRPPCTAHIRPPAPPYGNPPGTGTRRPFGFQPHPGWQSEGDTDRQLTDRQQRTNTKAICNDDHREHSYVGPLSADNSPEDTRLTRSLERTCRQGMARKHSEMCLRRCQDRRGCMGQPPKEAAGRRQWEESM